MLIVLVTAPLLYAIYGSAYWQDGRVIHGVADVLISWILPAIAIILFWMYRQATPGKMAIGARIVDAATGGRASPIQLVVRYLGYFVAMIPLFLGIIWVAFDARKQGWHDKIAGTVVVRPKVRGPAPVNFRS